MSKYKEKQVSQLIIAILFTIRTLSADTWAQEVNLCISVRSTCVYLPLMIYKYLPSVCFFLTFVLILFTSCLKHSELLCG